MTKLSIPRFIVASILLACVLAPWPGCGTGLLPGAGLGLTPFASIQWQQRPDLPNFTVSFDVSGAVNNPNLVTQVNWVFGDGTGFVVGGVQADHRYASGGRYTVIAYLFDSSGYVDSVSTTINVVVSAKSSGPNPAHNAADVSVNTLLNWTPGASATTSAIYLGDNLAAVQAGDASTFQGEVSLTSFDPPQLTGGIDYYWRVDAVSQGGRVIGDVWTFRTTAPPGAIVDPSPANGATDAAIDATLTWTPGAGATSHDVYFGTDPSKVGSAGRSSDEFQGNQSEPEFTPEEALEVNTSYFWRVDEVGDGGTSRGAVLQFRTAELPGKATGFSPADGATGVRTEAKLTWTAGPRTTSHDVYLGTNRSAVRDASRSSPLFRGNQEETEFEPTLAANTRFFWRIDEVGPAGTTKGDVLEFRTSAAPGVATEFEPEGGEIEVPLAPVLRWKAGLNVEEHLLYFGTDQDEVSGATADDETGILRATLDIGMESFEPGATTPLAQNKDYFWRLDERGPGGIARGPVLKFTTRNPVLAGIVAPAHRAESVSRDVDLSWTSGQQNGPPISHDVYLSKDQAAATNGVPGGAAFMGNFPVGVLTYDPGMLDPDTEYFWRIDERYPEGQGELEVAKGAVWRFHTVRIPPEQATNPSPANGAQDIDRNANLLWTAGERATSHDVYFGTDQAAVAGATQASPVFKGNYPNTTYILPELDPGQNYYWRIDEVNDGGTTIGAVWTFRVLAVPDQITNPSPADGAINQAIDVNLSWTAGLRATSHDVYFGEDPNVVAGADEGSAAFRGNQTETTFEPGDLLPNRTYFWRIDGRNSSGKTTGFVMSFSTGSLPDKATNPSPPHQSTNAWIESDLTWTAGSGAISHDVYFGTNQSEVEDATPASSHSVFMGNQSPTTFDPGLMQQDTLYFWRIDEVGTAGTRKGDVWRFRTAPAPTKAQLIAANGDGPADAAIGVPINPTLNWTPGTGVGTISNDVYFGTSFSAVNEANRMSIEFKVNQQADSYMPGTLIVGTRYYWRIDTVDSLGGTTRGTVWQFDTQLAGATATKFVILDPQDSPVGTPVVVTVQAQTSAGAVDTTFQQDVTLVVSGSATGGGLINIVNGVGTAAINDNVAETVTLSLQDSQATGLDVTSTQDLVFFGPLDAFLIEGEGGGPVPDGTAFIILRYQVTAIDAQGQRVSNFTGTVDITATLAFFGGPVMTTMPFINGRYVSGITFTETGLGQITATLTGGGPSGVSNTFAIVGG